MSVIPTAKSVLKKIYAIEPDRKNYAKLLRYTEAEHNIEIISMNCAAWNKDCVSVFESSGNRNSTAVATASYQHDDTEMRFTTIDSIVDGMIDYIKYDVEGGEREAFSGTKNTILTCHPSILISVYHRSRDIFQFINHVNFTYDFYRIYLRRLKCVPAWELNLILVPKTE